MTIYEFIFWLAGGGFAALKIVKWSIDLVPIGKKFIDRTILVVFALFFLCFMSGHLALELEKMKGDKKAQCQ